MMVPLSSAAGIIFSFLIATAYGSGFHVVMGGAARRIPLYLLGAWSGFAFGHFLGDFLEIRLLQLGAIHLFTGSLGAWFILVVSWLLVRSEDHENT